MKLSFASFSIAFMLLFVCSTTSMAQKVKYGKVSKKDLAMTTYDKDPDAEAVVLYENRFLEFIYTQEKGFKHQIKRHIRIKILKKSGIDRVDFPISLYHSPNSSDAEKLIGFKAISYNLVDGKVVKQKVKRKDLFKEKRNRFFTDYKYAIPNIQVGSIIDIQYTVSSDFFSELNPWQFQYNIPVVKSEYFVEVPQYFIYKTSKQGYESASITENEITSGHGSLSIRYEVRVTKADGRSTKTEQIQFKTKKYSWVAEHVPAFREERYMTAASNYISKIELELSGTDFPASFRRNFNQSWENIRYYLMRDDDYGRRLDKMRYVKSIAESLTAGLGSDEEKVAAIYHYVQDNFKWNKIFSHYTRTTTKTLLDKKEGVSADINFLLLQLLRAAKIEANPVSMSTRAHGFLNPVVPKRTKFNHVIAAVTLGDNLILLDATDPLCPIGMLPEYDLNIRGRLFTDKTSDWVSLTPTQKDKIVVQSKFDIDGNGTLTGKIRTGIYGYAAKNYRERSEESEKKKGNDKGAVYFSDSADSNQEEGLEVISASVKDIADINKRVTASYDVKITDKVVATDQLLYINPMLYFGVKENPFTLEERKFPVDFSLLTDRAYIFQLVIPTGYTVDELPESIAFSLPENSGSFVYEFKKVNDNLIQLTYKFNINKTFFLPSEYPALREFYNLIIEKEGEQVVLSASR